jgi:hypothetical protein
VVVPLIFRHGAAEVAFNVAVGAWLVFELVMRVRQGLRARGPAALDPSAFVLMPALVVAVIAGEVLGRRGGLPWPGGLIWPVVNGSGLDRGRHRAAGLVDCHLGAVLPVPDPGPARGTTW